MQTFQVLKPCVRSRNGMVAAQNRHAAAAGATVLERGGNAIDAAVVTALVLSIVEPWLSGVGGGGFLVRADGRTGDVDTLDFNMRSAAAVDPSDYPLAENQSGNWFNWPSVVDDRNVSGYSSICIPGAVAGFAAALERHGTMTWADALEPAIAFATRGFEVDWFAALSISTEAPALVRDPETAALFLDQGRAPSVGDSAHPHLRPMAKKAEMLKRLAQSGARDFYEGEIARLVTADLQQGGSVISAADMASYQPTWNPAQTGRYRNYDVHVVPGLSGGPSFLDAMDRLSALTTFGPETSDADAALAYANAIRDTYQHRLTTLGHAARAASCTSHVSVVDRDGTMVALTNTLLSRFGSKVVLPNAGILMNNGMMWFDPRPAQPNSIKGGVKPLANMCPIVLTQDGRPHLAIGAAGGRTIFPTVLQIVSSLVDFGASLEDAFHRPRIDASTPVIKVDIRAGAKVAATVGRLHPVERVDDTIYPVNFAIPSAVMRDDGGFVGMVHPTSPWSAVVAADDAAPAS
ncbi:gamma-glutamyltransferase family protein [Microvirga antarctica]|uniref:gamma-glutamyltransferase family protein n=1 Tax=Microvirga antarctica TaxID=2819233 RepID=UPI001B3069D6|nr:gamma-glutamyltransferase [Microvirga antarctica]